MGWIKKAVVGRWLTKWLFRGGPWAVAAKLLGVAVYGAWKWRRETKQLEEQGASKEIEAHYEVVVDEPGDLGPGEGRIPPPGEQGRRPSGTVEGPRSGSIRTDIEA
ncbi:MAG: hypothetical protein R3326_01425 [Gemmatimonadota bacterium]|nr:hypothetical protein [Gemmatimonadota bacterium]